MSERLCPFRSRRTHPLNPFCFSSLPMTEPISFTSCLPKVWTSPRAFPTFGTARPRPSRGVRRRSCARRSPDGFSGRVGVVVAVKASGADDARASFTPPGGGTRPARGWASPDHPTLPAADRLVEPMEDDDFQKAAAGLVIPFADGTSRTLLDLAQELTAGKPRSITRAGAARG